MAMAERIFAKAEEIDKYVEKGDVQAIEIIRDRASKKYQDAYSFATKYCSFKNPEAFPIVDQNVIMMLKEFAKDKELSKYIPDKVKMGEIEKDYPTFKKVHKACQAYISQNTESEYISCKYTDMFLWQCGKDWKRIKRIISINKYAIDYYHQQLIARKGKFQHVFDEWGLSDEIIEQNKIGLADADDYDSHVQLSLHIQEKGISFRDLEVSGLVKEDADDLGMYADVFYGRIIFPIFAKTGEPVSMVGRSYLSKKERDGAVWLWLPNTPVFSQNDKNRCNHILHDMWDSGQTVQETIKQFLSLRDKI